MRDKGAYILGFKEIDKTKFEMVGGKGANLGEISTTKDIIVPEGFCVTTKVYKEIIDTDERLGLLLDKLTVLKSDDRKTISNVSAEIRKIIEAITIPPNISQLINQYIDQIGEENAFAVRSSATAEDLPTASFAGQQDTYLNIIGKTKILRHISKCWASLFTDRAVTYRIQNGFDHKKIFLSVVVQKMVFPDVAGILFTADPVTSNRKIISIDASFGLGEALVSGIVNADNYKVSEGKVISKNISIKKLAIYPLPEGGTQERELEPGTQSAPTLTNEQILQLSHIGRTIEAHFGVPQDIEWCLTEGTFYIVQSRPITTLFPIPVRPDHPGGPETTDKDNRVFVSVGHQQMMTDAMKPLGLSFATLPNPASMRLAAGRMFFDITTMLASPASRQAVMDTLGKSDPLIKDALINIIEREGFITAANNSQGATSAKGDNAVTVPVSPPPLENDPSIASGLIERNQKYLKDLKEKVSTLSGTDLFDFIVEDTQEFKKFLFDPLSMRLINASINAASWINEKMNEWIGEKNAADVLAQSVSNNITSEMGMELLDVADVVRSYPAVVEYLQKTKDDNFLDNISKLEGGHESRDAINAYLNKYGMRCAGEIDITRTRWSEKPATLLPLLLNNIKIFQPGESQRKFERGRQEAMKKERDILSRLKQQPDGEQKAMETKRMIDTIRTFAGYREYPKYAMVNRYFIYKKALLKEANKLLKAGIIHDEDDIYYLTIAELREVVRTNALDDLVVRKRKDEFIQNKKLTPPRVITSDGEIVSGNYKRENLPADAIVGLAVSSGEIEGRARVILNMEDANIEEGDILVTAFTDPSWTPLFVSIKGLVTEVGGLMTHGAVIAREYGLPAVVGVENATKLIKDGQRIRVNGTDGYIKILQVL